MNYRLSSEIIRSSTKFDPAVLVSYTLNNKCSKGGTMAAETKATDSLDKFLMRMWRLQLPEGETTYIRQLNYRQIIILWEVFKAYKLGKRNVMFQDLIIKFGIPDYSITKDTQNLREGKISYRVTDTKNLSKGAGWLDINRDGRTKSLTLTKKGKALCDEIWKSIH